MGRTKQKFLGEKLSQLDEETVREAASALLAFHKKRADKAGQELLLNESSHIKIIISLWEITGKKAKTYKIKVPHPLRTPETEVCLFTKDDNKTDSEETARKYQELLQEKGVTEVNEIMPLQILKKEYKAFESRRQLSKRYDIFLADERIFRLMHVHLGKEFYRRKKYPVTVDMTKGDLKGEILQAINATYFILTNRGNTNHLTAAHTGMTVDQVVENIMAAVQGITAIVPHGWYNIKAMYVRTDESVSLPIHTSLVFKQWETKPHLTHGDIWRLKKQLEVTGDKSVEAKPLPSAEEEVKSKRFLKRAQRKEANKERRQVATAARKAATAATKAPSKPPPGTAEGAPTKAIKRKASDEESEELKDVTVSTPAKIIIKEKRTSPKKSPRMLRSMTPGKRAATSLSAKKVKTK